MRKIIAIIILILVPVVLVNFVSIQSARGKVFNTFSTYRSEENGCRALYLWLQETGVDVVRLRDLPSKSDDINVIVFSGNNSAFSGEVNESNSNKWADWVIDGGTLILCSSKNLASKYGFEDYFYKPIILDVEKNDKDNNLTSWAMLGPWVGKEPIPEIKNKTNEIPAGWWPLCINNTEANAFVKFKGKGVVLWFKDEWLMSNREMKNPKTRKWVSQLLLRISKDGTIAFDEFHHGIYAPSGIVTLFKQYGLIPILIQVFIIIVVCVWRWGHKFGHDDENTKTTERNSREFVRAVSSMYRVCRPREFLVKSLMRAAWLKLGRSSFTSPENVWAELHTRANDNKIKIQELKKLEIRYNEILADEHFKDKALLALHTDLMAFCTEVKKR